jgi:hypothetical protein
VTIRRLAEIHGLEAVHADFKRTFESIGAEHATPTKRKNHDRQAKDRAR